MNSRPAGFTKYGFSEEKRAEEGREKEYPHKCIACGSKAFIGLHDIECTNPRCEYYKEEK